MGYDNELFFTTKKDENEIISSMDIVKAAMIRDGIELDWSKNDDILKYVREKCEGLIPNPIVPDIRKLIEVGQKMKAIRLLYSMRETKVTYAETKNFVDDIEFEIKASKYGIKTVADLIDFINDTDVWEFSNNYIHKNRENVLILLAYADETFGRTSFYVPSKGFDRDSTYWDYEVVKFDIKAGSIIRVAAKRSVKEEE